MPSGGLGDVASANPSPAAESAPDTQESDEQNEADLLGYAPPVSISIPAINVQSTVIPIGKNPDGTLAAPEGANINKAAWFTQSVTPGQIGPSVIEGHVDTVNGPSVFFNLPSLKPGNKVRVAREDGKTAEFEVYAVKSYPTEDQFPTELVYGGDMGKATLRLITCSNFDTSTGHYAGNTVVFAELTSVTPTT